MCKLLQIVALAVISIGMTFCSSEQGKSVPKFSSLGIEMVAHKGVHFDSIAPPNSIDAILLAHRAGFKTIEIDLNRTKDNEVILLHDNHLHETFRSANGYKVIDTKDSITYCANLTWEEMKNNFVFASPNPAMRRPVVQYKDALRLIKSLNLFPYLEFKQMSFEDRLDVVYEAIDEAEKILGKNNFIVTCWGIDVCKAIRKRYPYLIICCDPVYDEKVLSDNRFSYFPHWEYLNQDIIDKQHQEGYTVSTWTVDRTVFDSIVQKNVDKILTDNIAPQFDQEAAVFNDYSDDLFQNYIFEGEPKNNLVHLKQGDSIELKPQKTPAISFGAIHFRVEAKGKFEIEASGNFRIKRENFSDDFRLFAFQYMIYQAEPKFKITAIEDTDIKSIWYAVSKY